MRQRIDRITARQDYRIKGINRKEWPGFHHPEASSSLLFWRVKELTLILITPSGAAECCRIMIIASYGRTVYPAEDTPWVPPSSPRSPMRTLHQVLIAGTAVLLVSACAARPTTIAQANSDDTAQPACDGGSLLVVQNDFPRHIEVVELQKNGAAVVASLAPGERTSVRVSEEPGNRYEARAIGTNQVIGSARHGMRAVQAPSAPGSVRMEVQCR